MIMRAVAVVPFLIAAAAPLAAQHDAGSAVHDSAAAARQGSAGGIGVHAVPLVTHITPILDGAARTEVYLTQPMVFADVSANGGALRLSAAVSLEGLTLDRGEFGAGAYGEGYVDRRHPHTYLHELVITGRSAIAGVDMSVTAGRGFAPFGTDDPMMRPFVKFPVNHHLGQVLERLVLIGAVRAGRVLAEAGVFSGSEPLDAKDMGSFDRFGDSWAARITVLPVDGLEVQASRAWVVSPELPAGGGWDQRKWSASGRYERAHELGSLYAMIEWNSTTQVDRGTDLFTFGSVLAEIALDLDGWRPAVRIERAERPEEQRLMDPFRTPWPHGGGHVLGITRWTVTSARLERAVVTRVLRMAPFIEGSMSRVIETEDGPFDPRGFYGGTSIWTVNVGARLGAGTHPSRMGRYGVAGPAGATVHEH